MENSLFLFLLIAICGKLCVNFQTIDILTKNVMIYSIGQEVDAMRDTYSLRLYDSKIVKFALFQERLEEMQCEILKKADNLPIFSS